MERKVKLRAGNYRIPVTLTYKDGRIFFAFGYNKVLMAEIKSMEGHKWHGFDNPPRKVWSVVDSGRNRFQIAYLEGKNPYAPYDGDLDLSIVDTTYPLRNYQREMAAHILQRKYCIIAGEMGTGKTLAWITAAEQSGLQNYEIWYVGPRAGVRAVSRELTKWEAKFQPRMFTYEGLVKEITNWPQGQPAPKMVCFDESSKLKTPTSQRSRAAHHLAESIREEWGDAGYVILMSGTPAPKSPLDWWYQCEIACPGFIKEGTLPKFKARLCIIEERESVTGGVYPHIVSWLDDERKCGKCGKYKDDPCHQTINMDDAEYHTFKPTKNEVAYLHKRMEGLVLVKLKKDCLKELPDKQYEIVHVTPTPEVLRAARLIKESTPRAITALSLLRELADGFQYVDFEKDRKTCPKCNGKTVVVAPMPVQPVDPTAPVDHTGETTQYKDEVVVCPACGGAGTIPIYERRIDEVSSPKDQVFIDDLDSYEEVGRYVVWGGFTGTIDRLVTIARKQGWYVLRVDGRGYHGFTPKGDPIGSEILLDCMDGSHPKRKELLEQYSKVCFVGQPQSGGMALTLTSSPVALFYSNPFDGEARMQAMDRIHRLGMDVNAGALIKDIFYLPTDKLVYDNLMQKKKLQNLTMGELTEIMG